MIRCWEGFVVVNFKIMVVDLIFNFLVLHLIGHCFELFVCLIRLYFNDILDLLVYFVFGSFHKFFLVAKNYLNLSVWSLVNDYCALILFVKFYIKKSFQSFDFGLIFLFFCFVDIHHLADSSFISYCVQLARESSINKLLV
jgi:hypothetical protein